MTTPAQDLVAICLRSKDADSRAAGARVITFVRKPGERLVAAVVAAMQDPEVAAGGAEILGRRGCTDAIKPLTEALATCDKPDRLESIAKALVSLEGNAAAPAIEKRLTDSKQAACCPPLALQLGKLCLPQTAPTIAATVLKFQAAWYVRRDACLALADCHNPKVVPALCEIALGP